MQDIQLLNETTTGHRITKGGEETIPKFMLKELTGGSMAIVAIHGTQERMTDQDRIDVFSQEEIMTLSTDN